MVKPYSPPASANFSHEIRFVESIAQAIAACGTIIEKQFKTDNLLIKEKRNQHVAKQGSTRVFTFAP